MPLECQYQLAGSSTLALDLGPRPRSRLRIPGGRRGVTKTRIAWYVRAVFTPEAIVAERGAEETPEVWQRVFGTPPPSEQVLGARLATR